QSDNDTIKGNVASATGNTLTATASIFPAASGDLPQGLLGAQVTITGGPGTGQVRFISSNTNKTLTIDRPWTTMPTADSTFSILRYEAVKVHSVDVKINDNDSAGLIIKESDGSTNVKEIATGAGSLDATLSDAQKLANGFTDTFDVSLTKDPGGTVTVSFAPVVNPDGFAGVLRFFNSSGIDITSTGLTCDSTNYNKPQTVTVKIVKDGQVEGPYHERVTLTTSGTGGYSDASNTARVNSFVVNIADGDSPQVVVTESAGSTN